MPLSFTMYQFTLGLHAIFAISFIGVAGANSVIGPLSRENPQHALFGLKVSDKLHKTLVLPGIVGIFLTGVYLMIDGDWSDAPWLMISVALFFVLAGLSIFVLHPASKIAIEELENHDGQGPPSERFQAQAKKLGAAGPFMGIMLMLVAFLMAAKPF